MTGWLATAAAACGLLFQTASFTAPTLNTIDREIRDGVFGHVDRLFVIRKGEVVADKRYHRDYHAIRHGATADFTGAWMAGPTCRQDYNGSRIFLKKGAQRASRSRLFRCGSAFNQTRPVSARV